MRLREDRVHQILTDSLYAQPGSLAISSVSGILASALTAWITQNPLFVMTALVIAIITVLRFALALWVPKLEGAHYTLAADLFMGSGLLLAFLSGHNAALTIQMGMPFDAQLLSIGYALAFAAGISARNACRPSLALGQLFLALVPPMLALAMRDGLAGKLMALNMAFMLPAMASVTIHIYRAFRKSIASAEASSRMADRLRVVARTDVVTGLLNRAGLDHAMPRLIDRSIDSETMALFLIDLDRFKEVNDVLGHQTGDRLLAEVAVRLRHIAPEDAVIARFGGDEFVLACPSDSRLELRRLSRRLLEEIARPLRIDGQRLEISASIGLAVEPAQAAGYDALVQGADLALYEAKAKGRNQISLFKPEMAQRLVRRRVIEMDLRKALHSDGLSVFFQPIFDLETGRIRSFEALARWFHPEKGELAPDEFIPIAEESGAIMALGNWLTARAIQVAASWPEDVTLAINLSPLQIRAPGAAMSIIGALHENGLDPARLEIEITEGVLLEPTPSTECFIAELASVGVRFALDDFGTGYSSLGSLNAHPFSRIKIDRSFVSGIHSGLKSLAIIRAVTSMAGMLDMDVVAEGIETAEQAESALAAGCTLGQGYFFSRAVPRELVPALIAASQRAAGSPRPDKPCQAGTGMLLEGRLGPPIAIGSQLQR